MNRIETFGFPQTHVQRFHCAQLETSIVDSLNYVTGVARTHCVGFDYSEGKIPHLLCCLSPLLILAADADKRRSETAEPNSDFSYFFQFRSAKTRVNPRLNFYAAARAASASFIPVPMSAGDPTT